MNKRSFSQGKSEFNIKRRLEILSLLAAHADHFPLIANKNLKK